MSSTNHTTNYNLPQFVGSDKPAWLGDINPAMNAIDTAIHASAVKAQQGVDDASTAQTTANQAIADAGNAQTTANTAQGTANTAIGNAQTVATALDTFMRKFNFTSFTKGDLNHTSVVGTVVNDLTLAQNSDGSIFKVYGNFQVNPSASATRTAIAGMSGYYGVNTGLHLFTAPTEAFIVKGAGILGGTANNGVEYTVFQCDFAVGTDGYIYILPDTNNTAVSYAGSNAYRHMYFPCVYFNASFGDTPTPQN